jgi:predicted nucleic acid-binding protein
MVYMDTSVIVAYYCPEALSEKAEAFITTHARPAISPLTELELFSAISRKIREGNMDRKDGSRIIAKFLSHLDDLFYNKIPIEQHHYRLARDWIGQFITSLRSLDAIHLSIASSEGATLVTADEVLATSRETLAVDVILLSAE